MHSTLFAAAAVMTIGSAAYAIPVINGGDLVGGDQGAIQFSTTGPNDAPSTSFTYTATVDLMILDVLAVTGNGFAGGTDLEQYTVGYDLFDVDGTSLLASDDAGYDITVASNGSSSGEAEFNGFTLLAGQSFEFFFNADSIISSTFHQATFSTVAIPTAVPLPAGGLLLIGGLGALAAVRKRKAAKKA